MVVNGKVALNPYTTDIEYMDLVSIGDMIVANEDGSQFNVTENKEYRLLAYSGDCVKIIDDTGKEEWYSVDYFHSLTKTETAVKQFDMDGVIND